MLTARVRRNFFSNPFWLDQSDPSASEHLFTTGNIEIVYQHHNYIPTCTLGPPRFIGECAHAYNDITIISY